MNNQINKQVIKVYESLVTLHETQASFQAKHLELLKKMLAEEEAILNAMLFRIAFIQILIFLTGIVLAFLLSRFIAGSLWKLEQSASAIARGDLDTPVECGASDEIGSLGKALESMRKMLKAHSANLEKEIASRTRELQKKNEDLERFNQLAVGRELRMVELKKRNRELTDKLAQKESE